MVKSKPFNDNVLLLSFRMRSMLLALLYSLVLLQSCKEHLSIQNGLPPNIVFIMADDLGKEWISCYGADSIKTEHLDQLASTGIRFNNVYSMPQCTPTRLTFLTGQYPYRHGWVNHWDVPRWGGGAHFDDAKYPSLGRAMKAAGYKTAIAGKWQIDDFRVEPDALTRNGFDQYCMWPGYETGVPASAQRYQEPYVYCNGAYETKTNDFGPNVFTTFIENFIRENKKKPLFIYYPMVIPHSPFVNTPDESADTDLAKHKAMVRYTDNLVGRIVKVLEDEGVRNNTLIIWTADNGTTGRITGSIAARKVKGQKGRTAEAGLCVPFIVNWPAKINKGYVSDALIDFTDMYKTFIDLSGSEIVEHKPLDGKSFRSVLLNPMQGSERSWILGMGGGNYAALTVNGVENQYRFRDRVLRNERYKLYINTVREPEMFIDLLDDPAEQFNLIDSLNTVDRRSNFDYLTGLISMFPLEDNDPIYDPNPDQPWDVKITQESGVWKL